MDLSNFLQDLLEQASKTTADTEQQYQDLIKEMERARDIEILYDAKPILAISCFCCAEMNCSFGDKFLLGHRS